MALQKRLGAGDKRLRIIANSLKRLSRRKRKAASNTAKRAARSTKRTPRKQTSITQFAQVKKKARTTATSKRARAQAVAGPLFKSLEGAAEVPEKSSYELEREERIRKNRAKLAELGIAQARLELATESQPASPRARKAERSQTVAQRLRRRTSSPYQMQPTRSSKRQRGQQPNGKPDRRSRRARKKVLSYEEQEKQRLAREKKQDKELQLRWNLENCAHKRHDRNDKYAFRGRRLFCVPTGVPGVNDHTLETPVKALDSYLWGFCRGLYDR